jgi:hypothetical protein
MQVRCRHLDWQVASAVQILNALGPVLSIIEQLTLRDRVYDISSEWHNGIDRTQGRELLRPFNVRVRYVQNDLIPKIPCSLRSNGGESPLDLLPNLNELVYSKVDVR